MAASKSTEDKFEELINSWRDVKNCGEELKNVRAQRANLEELESQKADRANEAQKTLLIKCSDFLSEKDELVSKLEKATSENKKHEDSLRVYKKLNRSLMLKLEEMRATKGKLEETLKVTSEQLASTEAELAFLKEDSKLRLEDMSVIKDEVAKWQSKHQELSSDFERTKKELECDNAKLISSWKLTSEELDSAKAAAIFFQELWEDNLQLAQSWESRHQSLSSDFEKVKTELEDSRRKLSQCEFDLREGHVRIKELVQVRKSLLKKFKEYFQAKSQQQKNLAQSEHELKKITEQLGELDSEGSQLTRKPRGSGYPEASTSRFVPRSEIDAEMDGGEDDPAGVGESEQLSYEGRDSQNNGQVLASPSRPKLTRPAPLKQKAATCEKRWSLSSFTKRPVNVRLDGFPLKNDVRKRHLNFASQNSLTRFREKKGRDLTGSVKSKESRQLYYCSKCQHASKSNSKADVHRRVCCPDHSQEHAVVKARRGGYGRYKCPLCSFRYAWLSGFSSHCARSHKDYRKSFTYTDNILKCGNCKDKFEDPSGFHHHLNQGLTCSQPPALNAYANPKLNVSIPPGIGTSSVEKVDITDLMSMGVLKEAFTCGVCKRIGSNMRVIADCLRSHGVYRCAICFNSFLSKEQHSSHARLCHMDNSGRLTCPICGVTGGNVGGVTRHMWSTHWKPILEDNVAVGIQDFLDQILETDMTAVSDTHSDETVRGFPAAESSTLESGAQV